MKKGSGLESVAVDNEVPVEFYNLQGVRVANPEAGIYIRPGSDVVVPCTFSTFGNAYQTGVAFGGEGDGSFSGGEAVSDATCPKSSPRMPPNPSSSNSRAKWLFLR